MIGGEHHVIVHCLSPKGKEHRLTKLVSLFVRNTMLYMIFQYGREPVKNPADINQFRRNTGKHFTWMIVDGSSVSMVDSAVVSKPEFPTNMKIKIKNFTFYYVVRAMKNIKNQV